MTAVRSSSSPRIWATGRSRRRAHANSACRSRSCTAGRPIRSANGWCSASAGISAVGSPDRRRHATTAAGAQERPLDRPAGRCARQERRCGAVLWPGHGHHAGPGAARAEVRLSSGSGTSRAPAAGASSGHLVRSGAARPWRGTRASGGPHDGPRQCAARVLDRRTAARVAVLPEPLAEVKPQAGPQDRGVGPRFGRRGRDPDRPWSTDQAAACTRPGRERDGGRDARI